MEDRFFCLVGRHRFPLPRCSIIHNFGLLLAEQPIEKAFLSSNRFCDTTPLGILHDNPSKATHKVHLFVAENAIKVEQQQLDITEEIDVVLVPLEAVMEKIANKEICVSGTVAAIFLGLNFFRNRPNIN